MDNRLNLEERLTILANGARYDASCASSGVRHHGERLPAGVCHSWSADGRCVSLLKILLTNACIYDCAYCFNRRSNDLPRTALTPDEIADLTIEFHRRNYIEGLFLSTGIVGSPDRTMELLLATARKLRVERAFRGYLHVKVIPGADPLLIAAVAHLADRVSVNIELPSAESLTTIAPEKNRQAIFAPMRQIADGHSEAQAERRKSRRAPLFAPAGQSTQLIVGASPENDRQIVRLAEGLYKRMELRRVYYSAFIPGSTDNRLPALAEPPLLREHRLYQADWLLRFYGFAADELLTEECPHFDLHLDPKAGWALRHPQFFPLEVQRADYEQLLRVPGIGVRSAQRILRARRTGALDFAALRQLGVVLKRARYFITANGRRDLAGDPQGERLRHLLLDAPQPRKGSKQLELFSTEATHALPL